MYKHDFGEAVAVWIGRLDWSWPLGEFLDRVDRATQYTGDKS